MILKLAVDYGGFSWLSSLGGQLDGREGWAAVI